MITPNGYDPITLHHWLWWRLLCFDATFEGFQRLFEAVMQRADPRFMAIRPYGNIGDRKCDGLYFEDGVVFQVYSPDELKQAELQEKIEEDLAGAVQHWKDRGLRRWVFVYNARRGLPPDIPGTLAKQKREYPWLEIDHLSDAALWEMVRDLPLQKRVEILGPPPGYEYLFLSPANADPETVERLRRGRFVLIHDALSPIDVHAALEALEPDVALGPPVGVRPAHGPELWAAAAELQRVLIEDAIERSSALRPRFAVFSLSPVPLIIHLGFLLSDRVEVQPFQLDRERKSWRWDEALAAAADFEITVSGIPGTTIEVPGDVVVRVSLSDVVQSRDTQVVVPDALAEIDIRVADPDRMWLRSPEQLVRLAHEFRRVLKLIGQRIPNARRIHLFACAPAPACLVLGQAINPRMTPEVALYEFGIQKSPRQEHVLTLTAAGVLAAENVTAIGSA
jgi:hypothetical protein